MSAATPTRPTHTYSDGPVNISGLLQNLLNDTFSTAHCISELLDNSFGAGATNVHIHFDTDKLKSHFVDEGNGMTKDELGQAPVLHGRTGSSEQKDGCFGIGMNHALSHLTQNNGKVHMLSKCDATSEHSGLYELEIDLANAVKTNSMPIVPHAMSMSSYTDIWKNYAINSAKTGTIIQTDVDPAIMEELCEMIRSDQPENSLRYFLGSRYYKSLEDGSSITIHLNEEIFTVAPANPLVLDKVATANKSEKELQVYRIPGTNEIRVYYKNADDVTGYKQFDKSNRGKFIVDDPAEDYLLIGTLKQISAYSDKWHKLKRKQLAGNGITIPEKISRKFLDELNGTRIIRNKKVIQRFPAPIIKSGDESHRTINYDSLCNVSYKASDEMDRLFKLNINKSTLADSNVHRSIMLTIKGLHDEFIKACIKIYEKNKAAKVTAAVVAAVAVAEENTAVVEEPVRSKKDTSKKEKTHKTPTPVATKALSVTVTPIAALSQAPVPAPAPAPSTKVIPIPVPEPKVGVTFSKSPTHIVFTKGDKTYKVRYKGQYNKAEAYYKEQLMELGEERFIEWICELGPLNDRFMM